jgi:hypothetical protein
MTGPEPGPYGGEGYNPAPQPQFGAPQPPQYPPAPQPPQYPPAPQPPQYAQPTAGPPYGQPPPAPAYGQPGEPPYGQPPYATVPPYGQPPVVPNRKPLIYGGIAAVVIIIAIIATVVLVSGGGDTPKGVAQDYLDAAKKGDVAKVKSLTCDKNAGLVSADTLGTGDSGLGDIGSIDFSVQDVHESGDTAVVNIKITIKANLPDVPGGNNFSGSIVQPLPLVKEHGSWKVCIG